MGKRFGVGLLTVLAIAGYLVTFEVGDIYVSGTWRYKMTVAVETPEGLKTGSAVREISNSDSSLAFELTQSVNPGELKGEAVVVDLGSRGKLFALLSGYKRGPDYAEDVVFDVFPYDGGYSTAAGIRHYRSLKDAKATLTPTDYPVLVMFKDIKDPKTVTSVLEMETENQGYPKQFRIKADHFEELFGKGVKLKEITIEMTDEKVTWGIVDQYLLQDFWERFRQWMISMNIVERGKYIHLFALKQGE